MARKILLADDSVTAQNMGRRILTDAGYEVTTVNNGSAALKKIAEQRPDLIVLDVYMPGYGGLEVCQRLKENRDTARIPVLLTVGKLEPFKADEARRVRADAFIVKPFEASELLTALTKLEEKIVPQAEAYKPGRFAKAIASVDQVTEQEDFGDKETGWKARIKFPSGKPRETEPEPESVPAAGFRDPGQDPDFKPAEPKFERPLPAGLPQDITPEEIAAITAAAASFSAKAEAPPELAAVSSPVPEVAEPPKPAVSEAQKAEPAATEAPKEVPPATFASAPQAASETTVAEKQESSTPPPQETSSAVSIEPVEAPAAPVSLAQNPPALPAEAAPHKPADADVLAALATLMPMLPADEEAPGTDVTASPQAVPEEAQRTPAIAAATTAPLPGPRWIAEPVPIDSGEASLVLEREMEKTFAAMAAAEAAQAAPATAAAATAVAVAEASSPATEAFTAQVGEPKLESVTAPAPAVAEVAAEKQPEAAPAPETAAVSSVTSVTESRSEEPLAESALAAAACAGPGLSEPSPEPAATTAPVQANEQAREAAQQDAAATAAAWANWRQIRDSVVGSQLASQITDAAAAGLKQAAEDPASSEAEAEAAAADPNAIASIVDSVLAELKPKLVEEIARKMGDEKNKSKKKKS